MVHSEIFWQNRRITIKDIANRTMIKHTIITILLTLALPIAAWAIIENAEAGNLIIHDAEHATRDTTIILNYGMMPLDTITVSKSSATFLQIQEAESMVQGIEDQRSKNRAIMDYVFNHPDSDGSVYLLNHLKGIDIARKCLSAISESTKNGNMKRLYDAYDAGIKEFDSMTAKTAEANPIGKEAKDFTLEDIDGKMLTLSSLRGKYVMLDFWGSWCANCIAEYPKMKAFYQQHRDKLEIVGVAIHDEKDKWKDAARKNELPWLLVIDTEGDESMVERFGIIAAPTYVLIDPEGKVVKWTIGEFETIEDIFAD